MVIRSINHENQANATTNTPRDNRLNSDLANLISPTILFKMKSIQSRFLVLIAVSTIGIMVSALTAKSEEINSVDKNAAAALGTYTGRFGPHRITISIEKIVGRTLTGYSIVTGNERAFSGSWQTVPDGIAFIAKEPGDHLEDGVFTLTFNATQKTLVGQWDANDQQQPSVELELKARTFKYNANVGDYPKASQKLLKESDVENMRPEELRIMRNEIYARHGYSFQLEDMQKHFSEKDWYMPVIQDVKDKLTPLETKNAALIKRYENYGEAYYDRFGR